MSSKFFDGIVKGAVKGIVSSPLSNFAAGSGSPPTLLMVM